MSGQTLRYTLLGDGSSDAALLPVLAWLLREHLPSIPIERGQIADLGRLPSGIRPDLSDLTARMQTAVEFTSCDVLFFHRDAEHVDQYDLRRSRILNAAEDTNLDVPVIPLVPVRMTESWLLHDEEAVRRAAGKPNGTTILNLPSWKHAEQVHAKDRLFHALRTAAALSGRRAKRFNVSDARARLAWLIDDFSSLRRFNSFRDLERDVDEFCTSWTEC